MKSQKLANNAKEQISDDDFVYKFHPNEFKEFCNEFKKEVELITLASCFDLTKCDNCGCHPTVIYPTPSGRFCEKCKPQKS